MRFCDTDDNTLKVDGLGAVVPAKDVVIGRDVRGSCDIDKVEISLTQRSSEPDLYSL